MLRALHFLVFGMITEDEHLSFHSGSKDLNHFVGGVVN